MMLLTNISAENYLRAERITDVSLVDGEPGYLFPGGMKPTWELLYVEKGRLHAVAGGKALTLYAGELTLVGAEQWHMEYAGSEAGLRMLRVSFVCTPENPALLNRRIVPEQQMQLILKQLVLEWENREVNFLPVMTCQLTQLLLLLQRRAAKQNWTAQQPNGEQEIIRRALSCVAAHCRERLTVPLVAQYTGVSPSYLTALFQKNLEISPGLYIRRVKLQESKRLIREGDLTFTEISALMQYSTVHQFSRQFRDTFGITPSEYAKLTRQAGKNR